MLIHATCPAHLIHLDLVAPKIFSEEKSLQYVKSRNFLHIPCYFLFTSKRLVTLFENTLNVRYSGKDAGL
jgi:hypothetical protein